MSVNFFLIHPVLSYFTMYALFQYSEPARPLGELGDRLGRQRQGAPKREGERE